MASTVLGMRNIEVDKIKPRCQCSGEKGLALMKTAGIRGGSVAPLRASGTLRSDQIGMEGSFEFAFWRVWARSFLR